jgi:hypothetical protein
MPPRSFDPRTLGKAMTISQVGLEMAAPIGIGLLADHWLRTLPLLTVLGALVGLVGGMVHLQILLRPPSSKDREDNPEDQP